MTASIVAPNHLFPLAIVKGLVEQSDGTRHFGSTGSFRHWEREAIRLGLVEADGETVTAKGRRIHAEFLHDLPDTRQVFWDRKIIEAASVEIGR